MYKISFTEKFKMMLIVNKIFLLMLLQYCNSITWNHGSRWYM